MTLSLNTARLLGKLIFYVIFGLVSLIAASVILSLASVVLVLAIAGAILWFPVRFLVRTDKKQLKKCGNQVYEGLCEAGQNAQGIWTSAMTLVGRVNRRLLSWGQVAGTYILEMGCGAGLGALLVYLAASGQGQTIQEEMMATGILLGAGLGILVALTQRSTASAS